MLLTYSQLTADTMSGHPPSASNLSIAGLNISYFDFHLGSYGCFMKNHVVSSYLCEICPLTYVAYIPTYNHIVKTEE